MLSDAYKQLMKSGSIGVIPTDTVYGVVARAEDKEAVKRLYALKKRVNKPGTIIAASIDQLVELGIKRRYLKAVEQFWPGAVSVEIPHHIGYLSQGTGRQAFRIPDNKDLIELLTKTGPLQTTSANEPDKQTAKTIKEAKDIFASRVDFYIDGGDLSNNQPSTIIRILDDAIEVVRQGSVNVDEVLQ
jgi:L-threonylcarbamoyladenylate synthase